MKRKKSRLKKKKKENKTWQVLTLQRAVSNVKVESYDSVALKYNHYSRINVRVKTKR